MAPDPTYKMPTMRDDANDAEKKPYTPRNMRTPTFDSPSTHTPTAEEDQEQRGRLKRRRMSSHSPPRDPSPSRGHERESGSRHRQHYRKHHRPSSPSSADMTPPPYHLAKKNRRRSDAEPDHTLRGRARNRSGSRGRTRSPIMEGDVAEEERKGGTGYRRRSQPPSRHRDVAGEVESGVRRQRSYPNLYKGDTGENVGGMNIGKDSGAMDQEMEKTEGVKVQQTSYEDEEKGDIAPAVQEV